MKIIKPSAKILSLPISDLTDSDLVMRRLEQCARVCYKSENKITSDSAEKLIRQIIAAGHESVLEHFSVMVQFICDRGVSHEIVRHRLASYSMESTRYCNYNNDRFGNEITVILPCFFDTGMGTSSNSLVYDTWKHSCEVAEEAYFKLLEMGANPQQARTVLPHSLKTELIMTATIREWRHFLKLRTDPAAHPQMRELTVPLLEDFRTLFPVIFEDIG